MGFTREVRTIDKEFLELDKQTQKLISKHERNIKKNYKKALDDLRKQVADLYEKYGDADGKLSLETMNKYARLDNLKKSIQDSLNEVYKANKQEIYANLKEVYKLNSEGVVKPLEKSISYLPNTRINFEGILKTLDVAKTINEEMAGLNWAERLGKHRADVIYNVEKTVREGLYNGDTYKTMATRLKDSLEGDVINPTRIVRTEGARVMSTAQTDVLNRVADKVPMKKIWLSANDERTRDTHIAMHKKEVDYEDVFILPDGTEMFAPLQGGNAKNVINCRCVMSIRIAEEAKGKAWKEPTAADLPEVPVRPSKKDYQDIEDYYTAREKYSNEKEKYNVKLAEIVEISGKKPIAYDTDEKIKGWAARNNFRIDNSVLENVDKRVLSEAIEVQDEMLSKYPFIKKRQDKLHQYGFGYEGDSSYLFEASRGLNFGSTWKDYEYGLKQVYSSLKEGYFTFGDGTLKTLIRHEFGHNIDNYIKATKLSTFDIDDIKIIEKRNVLREKYENELVSLTTKYSKTEYAFTNKSEAFAEGFAEYSSNPESEYGKMFGAFLERWLE